MKKNMKNGFTLIELLAVIVILAVIALIATPIIMNVINDSKEGSAKDSMYGYVKAVELATINTVTAITDAPDGVYKNVNGNLVKGTENLGVNFKGTKPKDGGYVILENGKVASAGLEFDGHCIKYDGSKADVSKDCSAPSKTYNVGEEVYFDPTGAVTDCNASKIWTPTNTGTTCYKWNVIKDSGSSVEILLDHNLGGNVEWDSSYAAKMGPKEAYEQLKVNTTNWSKVSLLTSSDNVVRNNAASETYTIDYTAMRARLISAKEIADLGKGIVWEASDLAPTQSLGLPWLVQNLSSTESGNQPLGYWTDTAHTEFLAHAWTVHYSGILNVKKANDISLGGDRTGIRPVARVLKSNI